MARKIATVAPGRLDEMASREDALLLASSPVNDRWDSMLNIYRFSCRSALEAFCRRGSKLHAVVKTPVHPNMLVNLNTQRGVYPQEGAAS